jgi:alpha-1,2-glucosyltransferase
MHRLSPASGGRDARALRLLAVAVAAWIAAAGLLWLHVFRGPAQQSVNVQWTPDTSVLVREALERTLRLRDGEESEPGRWVYRLGDQSADAVRRIVEHPSIADTGHIDRRAFRVDIDAPQIPQPIRVLLAMRLAPWVAGAVALVGLVAAWPARREARTVFERLARTPALEPLAVCAALGWGFLLFRDNGHAVDENIHYEQILRFAGGDWSLNPSLTMVPGFHALVALAGLATGGVTELSARVVAVALSAAMVFAFNRLVHSLHGEAARGRTLQFTVLPVLFTQLFLVYTDVTSLLFVLLMMLAAARGRPTAAGLLGLLSCLVRQNNVVWVAFAMAWMFFREGGTLSTLRLTTLRRYWSFIATGALFVLFVVVNDGQAALGDDVGSHPLGSLYVTNVFFLLFLTGVMMLPLVAGYPEALRTGVRRPATWLCVMAAGITGWLGFVVDHPHNLERADYFLPNALLQYVASGPLPQALCFVPVAIAVVWLCSVPMRAPWPLLLLFSVLFLLPEWLVTPRYYLIPLALFLAAREPASPAAERVQTACWAVASAALLVVMDRGLGWV